MTSFSARRLIPVCVISAACVAALSAPGAASAFTLGMCEGGPITGQGSSAQKELQQNDWNPLFNSSSNPLACSGSLKPKVAYTSTGSGAGLESWGVETKAGGEINFGEKNAFVGTEIAPNKTQEGEIIAHTSGGGKVLTIPVAQPAITIILHLPTGCTGVTGGPVPGRIAIKDATLEKVFEGTDTKWSQLLNKAKFTEATKKACNKTSEIHRVVREDGSGTTDGFKKYLGVINKNKKLSFPSGSSESWGQNGEKAANTEWPNEGTHPVTRGNGGGGLVAAVAATPGGIGYANLADARKNSAFIPPSGGAGTTGFWAEVENGKGSYADPSTNGDVAAKGNSNCEETTYTNGTKKFPPPSTEELWNEVTVAKAQVNYEPCYITFDLAVTKYNGYSVGTTGAATSPTEAEARTVFDYFGFELSTGSGGAQTEANNNHDYLGDPTSSTPSLNVLKIAQEGVKKIGF